jgi:hypothetical protein
MHTDIIESSSMLGLNGEALRPLEPAIRRGPYSRAIRCSADAVNILCCIE